MDKPIMIKAEEFRENLIRSINNSGLHIMIVKYILDDIRRIVDEEYRKALNKEIQEYQSNKVVEQQTIPNEEFEKIEQNQNNQSTS